MDYSNELWNPDYRCKQCSALYDAYRWIIKDGERLGREWACDKHEDFFFEPDQLPSEQLKLQLGQQD